MNSQFSDKNARKEVGMELLSVPFNRLVGNVRINLHESSNSLLAN